MSGPKRLLWQLLTQDLAITVCIYKRAPTPLDVRTIRRTYGRSGCFWRRLAGESVLCTESRSPVKSTSLLQATPSGYICKRYTGQPIRGRNDPSAETKRPRPIAIFAVRAEPFVCTNHRALASSNKLTLLFVAYESGSLMLAHVTRSQGIFAS